MTDSRLVSSKIEINNLTPQTESCFKKPFIFFNKHPKESCSFLTMLFCSLMAGIIVSTPKNDRFPSWFIYSAAVAVLLGGAALSTVILKSKSEDSCDFRGSDRKGPYLPF